MISEWSKPQPVYLVPVIILIRPDYDHRPEEKEGRGGFELESDGKKHRDKVSRMVYTTIKQRLHVQCYQQVRGLSEDRHSKTILISYKACGVQFTGILNKQ